MPQSTFQPAFLIPVAIGSALGGVSRYTMTVIIQDRAASAFPVGTLAVNVLGCLLIGLFVELAADGLRLSPTATVLLTTGFCGGFTTFSTFSYETIRLIQEGVWQRAVTYVIASVAAGLGAFWVGIRLARLTAPV